eukprot:gene7861-28555_t
MASRRCSKPLIGLSRHVLQFSYVGTEYSGVAPNQTSKLPSIHSKIYNALEHLSLAFPPVVALSSRTDAGVHAVCNTAHVDLWRRPRDKAKWLAGEVKSSGPYNATELHRMLNHYLPPTIAVHNVVNVPQSFHARFDATHREYVYRIICPTTASTKATAVTTHDGDPNCAGSSNRSDNRSTEKDDDDNNKGKPQKKQQQQQQHRADGAVWMPENPFEHNRCWQVRRTLNIKEMQKAAATLEGTHDFSSFRGAGCQAASPIKTVETVNVTALPLSSSALNFQTHMPPRTGGEVRSSSPSALSSVSS